jgi:hypothetical protein
MNNIIHTRFLPASAGTSLPPASAGGIHTPSAPAIQRASARLLDSSSQTLLLRKHSSSANTPPPQTLISCSPPGFCPLMVMNNIIHTRFLPASAGTSLPPASAGGIDTPSAPAIQRASARLLDSSSANTPLAPPNHYLFVPAIHTTHAPITFPDKPPAPCPRNPHIAPVWH